MPRKYDHDVQPISRILSAHLWSLEMGRPSFIWDGHHWPPLSTYPCKEFRTGRPCHPLGATYTAWSFTTWGLPSHKWSPNVLVGSYPTISPLTCTPKGHRREYFLLHLLSTACKRTLTSSCLPVRKHVALWCSDFPPAIIGRWSGWILIRQCPFPLPSLGRGLDLQ